MFNKLRSVLLSNKLILAAILLLFIVSIFSCSGSQISSHFNGSPIEIMECSPIFLVNNSITLKSGLLLGVFILFFTSLVLNKFLFEKNNGIHKYLLSILIFNTIEFFLSFYNSIKEAFRRGIINPKIYSGVITNS